jgi:hypothetical protein
MPTAISIGKRFIWSMQVTFLVARKTDRGLSYVVERYRVRERIRATIKRTALTLAAHVARTWRMLCRFAAWSWHTAGGLAVALDAGLMRTQHQIADINARAAVWSKHTGIRAVMVIDAWALRRQQIGEGAVRTASRSKRTVTNMVFGSGAMAMRTQWAPAAGLLASVRLTWRSLRKVDQWFMEA